MITDLNWSELKKNLTPRKSDAHKGDFGHSLCIGGNTGFYGAIILTALGAARVGSGLTSIATVADNAKQIPVVYPEIMAHGVDSSHDLTALLNKATAIAIGPGLGRDVWAEHLYQQTIAVEKPLVIDADALHFTAKQKPSDQNWILTPHPGEAAHLLDIDVDRIQKNRVDAIRYLHEKYHGIIVLKGHETLITNGKSIWRCTAGNPGMATGGMGDLLTGIITGLLAQHFSPLLATQIGVQIHAMAGDQASAVGQRGLLATDLLPFVRQSINS